jgi:hypothetical protein
MIVSQVRRLVLANDDWRSGQSLTAALYTQFMSMGIPYPIICC